MKEHKSWFMTWLKNQNLPIGETKDEKKLCVYWHFNVGYIMAGIGGFRREYSMDCTREQLGGHVTLLLVKT